MVDEIEVNVHEIPYTTDAAAQPFAEVLRKLLLAGIGAMALTRDEIEGFIKRLVERGELAQKDGEKLLREMTARLRPQARAAQAETHVESKFEQLLKRLNIPSKRDIDDLSAKITYLAERVEELRRSQ